MNLYYHIVIVPRNAAGIYAPWEVSWYFNRNFEGLHLAGYILDEIKEAAK